MQPSFWIISCGQQPSSLLCRELAELRSRTPKPFGWYVTADPSLNQQPPMPLAKLSGTVIVVDRNALVSEAFTEVVRLPISTMADRDDFSVFPWLRDLSVEELKQLATQGNPLAVSLVENLQLDPSMESLPNLMAALRVYLDNLETLRAFSFFERLTLVVLQVFGQIAVWVSVGVILGALAVSVVSQLSAYSEVFLAPTDVRDVSVILVSAAIPILLLRLHRLLSLHMCGDELAHSYPRFQVEFLAVGAMGLVTSLSGIPLAKNCGTKTIVVGVVLGAMLVAFVRKGRRASIQALPFAEIPQLLERRALLPQLYDLMAESTVNTGMPLFEPVYKRVFISYSRSSVWSTQVADDMAASLRDVGAFVYLDRPSLRPGLSWKRQLRWAIVNSNVFVVVLDKNAALREWIAAEFATAYRSKIVKRTPEIFVIHPKEMDFSEKDTPASAFFAELMIQPSRAIPQWMRSRMAPYTAENCSDICRAIWSYPIAGTLGITANQVLALVTGIVVPALGFASMLGLPLLVVHVLVMAECLKPSVFLAAHSELVFPLGFASAILGGFSLRSALRSFADIRRSDYSYVPGPVELLEAAAFFGAVAICLPWLQLVDTCLVFLAVFLGVECGSVFALCMRTWKRQS